MDLPYKMVLADDGRARMKRKNEFRMPTSLSEADIIMISGCTDEQTSADIRAGRLGNKRSAGAMTMAFRTAIGRNASASFKQLLVDMRKFLSANGFQQLPQLSS